MTIPTEEVLIDYKIRINRVFTFIDENLDGDLSLEVISEIAFFSPFHFHRVFKFITGETLNAYINRQKIEKSALDLILTMLRISEIARKYGFNSHSTFTRAFKKFYEVSPTEFREQNPNRFSKIGQVNRKNGQDYTKYEEYICNFLNLNNWIKMNAKINIKECPEFTAAGVTHVGVNGVESAFGKLIQWANSKHLMQNPEARLGRVFYDSFKVTAADKVRMSIFLKTSDSFDAEGEINMLKFNRGKCIVGHFEITPSEFEKSWTGLYIWMNENGYKRASENPYEIYHNDFRDHPESKFIVDLIIPIE